MLLPAYPQPARAIPTGPGWQYEPKWDGFRCLVFRDGKRVDLQSKSCKSLTRYFPEVVEAIQAIPAKRFILDGEIVVPVDGRLSFGRLLSRLNPSALKANTLAQELPATYIAFDLLATERGQPLTARPLIDRRQALERFAATRLAHQPRIQLSPATRDLELARQWFAMAGGDLDGIVAKRLDRAYENGGDSGMVKIKPRFTVDCVVGGVHRLTRNGASLLLGMYDNAHG